MKLAEETLQKWERYVYVPICMYIYARAYCLHVNSERCCRLAICWSYLSPELEKLGTLEPNLWEYWWTVDGYRWPISVLISPLYRAKVAIAQEPRTSPSWIIETSNWSRCLLSPTIPTWGTTDININPRFMPNSTLHCHNDSKPRLFQSCHLFGCTNINDWNIFYWIVKVWRNERHQTVVYYDAWRPANGLYVMLRNFDSYCSYNQHTALTSRCNVGIISLHRNT